uniref:Uncharacterized protein n=1 Tax=Corvus moneduloides TaxID=1196302 RepID=A0A8C3E014_CORMO
MLPFPGGKPSSHDWDSVNQPPRGGGRQRAPKPWLQVGSSKPWLQVGAPKPWLQVGSSKPWLQVGAPKPWLQVGSSKPWLQVGAPKPWLQVGSSKPWLQVGAPKPWLQVGLFWDWSCSVPLLCAPHSSLSSSFALQRPRTAWEGFSRKITAFPYVEMSLLAAWMDWRIPGREDPSLLTMTGLWIITGMETSPLCPGACGHIPSSLLPCSPSPFPEQLWLPLDPWQCPRPGWTGLGAAWDSGRCPCPWQGLGMG